MASRNEMTDALLRLIYSLNPANVLFYLYQKLQTQVAVKTVTWTDAELVTDGSGNKTYIMNASKDYYVRFESTGKPAGKILHVQFPKAELNTGASFITKNLSYTFGELLYLAASGERLSHVDTTVANLSANINEVTHWTAAHNSVHGTHSWWVTRALVV